MSATPSHDTVPASTTPPAPSFASGVWLVAQREMVTRLRSKSFTISAAILVLGVLAAVLLGGIFGGSTESTKVAVVGSAAQVVGSTEGLESVDVATRAEGEELLRSGDVSAIVLPSSGTPPVTVVGLDSPPQGVLAALSIQPDVELLDPASQPTGLIYIVALGFGIVFMMSALTFGTMIAQSVVEEKQTRIVEILLSTVSARVLLAGKVVGNSLLALGQIAAIAIAAVVGMMVTGQKVLLGTVGPAVAWFVVFFVIGFVLLAAIYAAAASLVSRSEDIGSVTSPVMILIMVPYFLVIFFNDNPTVMAIMSYVPFSAPVGMPVRIFLGTAEWWEPILSLAVLVASTAVVIVLGARVYSNSLLRTGARVKVSDALRG
ncbi:ABC transporter permease [Leifsonia sp. NPDC102414]|uniref:ABC transporter permease n=1 Tax=Leifsonia sp. NPDC102414 TaxID=3364124 RepID=UPI00381DC36B